MIQASCLLASAMLNCSIFDVQINAIQLMHLKDNLKALTKVRTECFLVELGSKNLSMKGMNWTEYEEFFTNSQWPNLFVLAQVYSLRTWLPYAYTSDKLNICLSTQQTIRPYLKIISLLWYVNSFPYNVIFQIIPAIMSLNSVCSDLIYYGLISIDHVGYASVNN